MGVGGEERELEEREIHESGGGSGGWQGKKREQPALGSALQIVCGRDHRRAGSLKFGKYWNE